MRPVTQFIAEEYGGKRAFLRHLRHLGGYYVGTFRTRRAIDFQSVERLVFICKGNICRSAFAQAVAARSGFDSASFGLDTPGDEAADPAAIRNARARGIDLEPHRTRSSRNFQVRRGDLLLALEPLQAEALAQLHPAAQVTLLGLWTQPVRPFIQDPYGRSDAYFQRCFEVIESGVATLTRRLQPAARTASP